MTSVGSGLLNIPKRSYISAAPLTAGGDHHVYSYARSYNAGTYTWSGALTGIDFTVAPYSTYNAAGVVFRETGKKLYKDANPGVDRYMVGVYIDQPNVDVGEMGQMFIDPNCSVFADFNGDRPAYIPTNTDDHEGGQDLGHPVYTYGDITTTKGDVVVSSDGTGSLLVGPNAAVAAGVDNAIVVGNATATTDNQIKTTGAVAAGTSVSAGTFVSAAQQLLLTDNRIVGQTTMVGGTVSGGFIRKTVTTAAVTLNSRIFLTNASQNNAGSAYSAEIIAAGSFNIVSNNTSDASTINWLVIN